MKSQSIEQSRTAGKTRCQVTLSALLQEMADLRRLADFPTPAYKTVQFSSYDRRSNQPGGPGWFGNADGFGGEPIPGFEETIREPGADEVGEYLICDIQQPGAIVRTWAATCYGQIRLYLDGSDEPLYDGAAYEFLTCPYRALGETAGLDEAALEKAYRQFDAGYCPIPFAKSCRITWTGAINTPHFYHVQIRLYGAGVTVEPFSIETLRSQQAELQRVARVLLNPDEGYELAATEPAKSIVCRLEPGQCKELLKLEGPAAIEQLKLKLKALDLNKAHRQTVLRITFDDYSDPQVESPVGDFFGAAPGVNPYVSLPFTVRPDGVMVSRFLMPFKSTATVSVENFSDQAVTVTGDVQATDYTWSDDTSMYFRARWRVNHGLRGGGDDFAQDIPFILANGVGVYVGSAIYLLNPCLPPKPHGGWWGEGDEKVFVDEDRLPSIFGTGSEDYFNYSWSVPDLFAYPYCAQPRDDGPGNRGFVTNNRWHIVDALPFRQRLAFYMELLTHDHVDGISYARIGYHYGKPGMYDDHVRITADAVRNLELPPNYRPTAAFGSRNTTFYDAEELAKDGGRFELAKDNLWVGGQVMIWRPSKVGEEITLRVPIAEDGAQRLQLGAGLLRDSGRIAVTLNDQPIFGDANGVLDLKSPFNVMLRQFGGRYTELTKGVHELVLRYVGGVEDGKPAVFGIDYVGVQVVPREE